MMKFFLDFIFIKVLNFDKIIKFDMESRHLVKKNDKNREYFVIKDFS